MTITMTSRFCDGSIVTHIEEPDDHPFRKLSIYEQDGRLIGSTKVQPGYLIAKRNLLELTGREIVSFTCN